MFRYLLGLLFLLFNIILMTISIPFILLAALLVIPYDWIYERIYIKRWWSLKYIGGLWRYPPKE